MTRARALSLAPERAPHGAPALPRWPRLPAWPRPMRAAPRLPRGWCLRLADPAETAPLAALVGAAEARAPWHPGALPPEERRALLHPLIDAGRIRVVAGPSGPAGFLARRGAEVLALYVAPDHAGRGLGRALLAEAQRRAARLTLWVAEANAPARAFYAAQGFRMRARGDGRGNEFGLPEWRYEWRRDWPAPGEARRGTTRGG